MTTRVHRPDPPYDPRFPHCRIHGCLRTTPFATPFGLCQTHLRRITPWAIAGVLLLALIVRGCL